MAEYPKQIERALSDFCDEFGLLMSTTYRGEEVRSIDVVDDQACSYQIWIEQSETGWMVKLWDRDSRSAEFPTGSDDLLDTLRSSYCELEIWLAEAGHTRTWVV